MYFWKLLFSKWKIWLSVKCMLQCLLNAFLQVHSHFRKNHTSCFSKLIVSNLQFVQNLNQITNFQNQITNLIDKLRHVISLLIDWLIDRITLFQMESLLLKLCRQNRSLNRIAVWICTSLFSGNYYTGTRDNTEDYFSLLHSVQPIELDLP